MYEYHQAVLHAVREGLLLLDADHRVQLANEETRSLLQLPTDCQGRAIADLGLPPALVEAAVGERAQSDDLYVIGGNALVVSSAPARRDCAWRRAVRRCRRSIASRRRRRRCARG